MNESAEELIYAFEKNLKWKLSQRAKTSADEFRLLMNTFKYYDFNPSGIIDKEQWKQSILKIGLINLSEGKLNEIFDYYLFKQNQKNEKSSNYLNYKEFSYNLLYASSNRPNIKRNNFFNRNNNTLKSCNYSYDFQPEKNIEEKARDKNIFNYGINLNINKEQNINKYIDQQEENKDMNNKYVNKSYNMLNHSYNNKCKIIDINDKNNNINIKFFIKNVIDIFRNKINIDNGVTFYTLLEKLKINSFGDNSDILSLSKLNIILKESNLYFTPKELQSLFCIIDFNDKGFISIKKFLKAIKGNLNEFRKKILIDIFRSEIDINKSGKISIYYFKELYNGKNHPDVLNKKMSENDVMTQFNYTFEIFCKCYKILGEINCSHFIKYYEGISPSISNDLYFKEIINNVWKRTNNFDETYFPTLNNQNINFNLEKKINRSISSPLISFNNQKMNTIGNIPKYNNNENDKRININNNQRNELLNRNYINYKNNALNTSLNNTKKNKIILRKINLTPVNNFPKITTPNLILNDIQNNNSHNYKQNNNKYNNLKLNNSLNINSIPHTNTNKYYIPVKCPQPLHPLRKNKSFINEEMNQNDNKDKYTYSQIILNSLRNILIKRGNKSIFYLQRMLINCDTGQNGLISLEQLNNIFRVYNFNLYFYDIKILFDLFDKKKIGFIHYDNFIKAIVGTMNERRKNMIIKIYNTINKDLYGFINIKDIKKRYNCYKHPDFIKGNKTHEEIYGDFLECIEIYREYVCNINKKNNDFFSYNEFLEFFDELSMFINDDNYFENLIYGCWDIK